ncbi:DUF4124 domain-containing protein [Microbulbifer epialgicus]|uniref:DUF4124 domain-containing protein n=1 Tax=Microbulbifer epialgicus TaxID=393907 RepID=A0ABV4NUM6_9GAMM
MTPPKLLKALLLSAPLVLFAGLAAAGSNGIEGSGAIYKIVSPDGKVTFSDTPPPNGRTEEVELGPINVQPIVVPRPLPTRKLSPKNEDTGASEKESYSGSVSIRIVSPQDGATIPPGQRFIALQVNVQPQYPEGASFYAIVDGQPWRGSSDSTGLDISALERGSHSLQAILTDASGKVLAKSQVITVFVHRPSVAMLDNSNPLAP